MAKRSTFSRWYIGGQRFIGPQRLEARRLYTSDVAAAVCLPIGVELSPQATNAPNGYTPQQIRHAYGLDSVSVGGTNLDGAGQTIAIVDAFDDPSIASDLRQFDFAFGLPDPPSFQKTELVAASGDRGDSSYPSSSNFGLYPALSPNVVGVGATELATDAAGDYLGEVATEYSGGGYSRYEPQPSYQQQAGLNFPSRVSPDVAFVGGDNSGPGIPIYDSYTFGRAHLGKASWARAHRRLASRRRWRQPTRAGPYLPKERSTERPRHCRRCIRTQARFTTLPKAAIALFKPDLDTIR